MISLVQNGSGDTGKLELQRFALGSYARLPWRAAALLLLFCSLPALFTLLGADFSSSHAAIPLNHQLGERELVEEMFRFFSGSFTHTILEWTATAFALFTVILAFANYTVKHDVVTPIIALALLAAGTMDAFHTLAADRLISASAENHELIPFTWAICRTFNAVIPLVALAMLYLLRRWSLSTSARRSMWIVGAVAVGLLLLCVLVIQYCATSSTLPQTMFPGSAITRPWDIYPLGIYVVSGLFLYPSLMGKSPSYFGYAIWLSVIPDVVTQLYMAFGSSALFDHNFNVAHFMKIVAYAVPCFGLVLDYVSVSKQGGREIVERQVAENRLRAIIDTALDSLLVIDRAGVIESCNPATATMFGYSPEELIGRNIKMLMPPVDRNSHDAYLANHLETGEAKIIGKGRETEAQRKDGHVFPIHLSVGAMEVTGAPMFVGIIRDISEARIFRDALQRAALFAELNPSPVVRFSQEGLILAANPAASTRFGRKVLIGTDVREVLPELQIDLGACIASGATKYQALEIGGVATQIAVVGETRLAFGHIYSVDISDLKKTEEKLTAANQRAQVANTAKSEFLAKMSHEIRTPMNGVLGMADLLADTSLNSEQQEYVHAVQTSGQALMTIINDILDFSKIESGQLDVEEIPFQPRSVVEQTVRMLARKAELKGVDLNAKFVADFPDTILGDPTRLRQVLMNLVDNAIKFTEIGAVTIETRVEQDAQRLCFEVCDTGIGIAPEKHERMFESFTQADNSTTRSYGGSGLGLTICRQLVGLMGGEIGVQSVAGEGSTFFFHLPLRAQQNVSSNAAEIEIMENTVPAPLRVLLAEDNIVNQKVACAMLKKLGHTVQVVGNGREAVEALQNESFDMVMMDCEMPVMNGFDATAAIRVQEASGARVPIIALTAHAMVGSRERCIAAGMDDFVTKPVRRARLAEAIARWA